MGRSPCCEKNGLKKGPWTPEEDKKLIDYINKHGYGNWRTLPKNAGLQRCGKSCRLRWTNYLRPDIKRGRFSFEEEEIIIQLHSIMGNKWSAIATRLPGRTDNEIKNYWNTHIRKRLLKMGIDPVTHSPRLDLLDISSILTSSIYNSPYHNHQLMTMSKSIIGRNHPLVNYPEILKLAASLFSNQNHTSETQIEQNQYQSGYNMIGNQELQSCEFQDLKVQDSMAPSYPSNYDGDCSKSNFVFEPFYSDLASVLTTSTSNPTPLNSSSTTYINNSTEDEKESYYSNSTNIMSISQTPDYLLDDNIFMQFQETKNDWDRVL